jgi:acyl-CoA synthetase (AMP-forming)/AMP-acid ligase II
MIILALQVPDLPRHDLSSLRGLIYGASPMAVEWIRRTTEALRTFRNDWFHAGDVGRRDEEGFVFLLDRKKDMVVSGGENVYTSEVEAVLYRHPGVHEAAVIGVPDETFGEALLAVVVPAEAARLTPCSPDVQHDLSLETARCDEFVGLPRLGERHARGDPRLDPAFTEPAPNMGSGLEF